MDINCKFETSTFINGYPVVYNCLVEGKDCSTLLKGIHKQNKSDLSVQSATLVGCSIQKFPSLLSCEFDNLERLCISGCGLTSITKEDLKGFENLKILWLDNNLIEELPGDLFNSMRALENVSFYKNKIEKIDGALFAAIPNILKFDLRYNQKFNLIYETDKGNSFEDFQMAVGFSVEYAGKTEKGLFGDLKRFIHNHDFRDFVITINDVEFDVHRFLLEARSPVLGEMIRNNPEVYSLNLNKVTIDVFRIIMDWMYEEKMPCERDDLVGIYDSAKQLELTELVEYTREKLLMHLNGENAVKAFVAANKYNDDQLKRAAFEEVRKSYPDLNFLSEDMLLRSQSNLEEILLTEKKFDDEIHEDMKRIEELRKKVEKKQQEKAKWIGGKLFEA